MTRIIIAQEAQTLSNQSMTLGVALVACIMVATSISVVGFVNVTRDDSFQVPDGLPIHHIEGSTDLPGNFYVSFVYTQNIMMLDGKGDIVWAKHTDHKDDGVKTGYWDFKKHVIDGETYYSYHSQDSRFDKYGLPGYAPGYRIVMDSNFNVVKKISFEQSATVDKGHPVDGHDFLMIDLDHYILSGYIKDAVYNNPGYEGKKVIYSYLQEVDHGKVVWDWKSIDYPEIYGMTQTDATPSANDFANETVDAPDYVHFNAMRLNDDGDLVCSFRHLDTVMCLDRTKQTDQIKWKLSGPEDMFGLSDEQKTSGQHYVTVDGDTVMVFDNHNITGHTRICIYEVDMANRTLLDFKEYSVPGKFSAACGSVQHLYDEVYAIGWGDAQNDNVCMSVYDFSTGKELMSMHLALPQNFTYRCVYYP